MERLRRSIQSIASALTQARGSGTLDPAVQAAYDAAMSRLRQIQNDMAGLDLQISARRGSLNTGRFAQIRSQLNTFVDSRPALQNDFQDVMAVIDSSADTIETLSSGAAQNTNVVLQEDLNEVHHRSNDICSTAHFRYRCYRRQQGGGWTMGY